MSGTASSAGCSSTPSAIPRARRATATASTTCFSRTTSTAWRSRPTCSRSRRTGCRRNVRVEGDVVFNAAIDWDSYSGARRRAVDFRRVALHEFGHVLGLDASRRQRPGRRRRHEQPHQQHRPPDGRRHRGRAGAVRRRAAAERRARRRQCRGLVSAPRRVARLPQPARGQVPGRAASRPDVHVGRHRRRRRLDVRSTCGTACISARTSRRSTASRRRSTATPRPASAATRSAGAVQFPPRNEALDFRNQLEAKYRDGLRRGPTSTTVDREGDVVWIAGVSAVPREQLRPRRRRAERAHADRRPLRLRRCAGESVCSRQSAVQVSSGLPRLWQATADSERSATADWRLFF